MPWLDLLSRWFHIVSACILVGGSFFLFFAWFPGLAGVADEKGREVVAGMRRRWAMWVGIASGLILVSGFYNAAMASINYDVGSLYNGVMGLKILLGVALMLLSSLLFGRSPVAEKVQARGRMWSGVAVLLSLALVLAGGVMKSQNKELRPKNRPAPVVEGEEPSLEIEFDPTDVSPTLSPTIDPASSPEAPEPSDG